MGVFVASAAVNVALAAALFLIASVFVTGVVAELVSSRVRPSAPPAPALRRHDRQRPRRTDLSQSNQKDDDRWTEPALGRRHNVCRHCRRLRLRRGHSRRLSRRAVGYAISRSIDVRLTLAAFNAAVERRKLPPGRVHHSDRGSEYAAQDYREALLGCCRVDSMGRRGNPYTNARAESFLKTFKVEAVYPMACAVHAPGRDPSRERDRSGAPGKVWTFAPRACRGTAPNIQRRVDRDQAARLGRAAVSYQNLTRIPSVELIVWTYWKPLARLAYMFETLTRRDAQLSRPSSETSFEDAAGERPAS